MEELPDRCSYLNHDPRSEDKQLKTWKVSAKKKNIQRGIRWKFYK